MEEYVRIIIDTVGPMELVAAFLKSDDESSKDGIFKIIIKKDFEFEVWQKLYLHEKATCNIRPKHKNAFFYKMAKTAKDFSNFQDICNSIERAANWRSIRIGSNAYKILKQMAFHFGECEIVCKTALDVSRCDYATAIVFMRKMFEKALTCAQYSSVADIYKGVYRGRRDYEFERLLAQKIYDTAVSFEDWAYLCRFSNRFNLGYRRFTYDQMIKMKESRTVKGLEVIFEAIHSDIDLACSFEEVEWIETTCRFIVRNLSKIAKSYEGWKIVIMICSSYTLGSRWVIHYLKKAVVGLAGCLSESNTEFDFRWCSRWTIAIGEHFLLEEVLRKYTYFYNDLGAVIYASQVIEANLGKKFKGNFRII